MSLLSETWRRPLSLSVLRYLPERIYIGLYQNFQALCSFLVLLHFSVVVQHLKIL